MSPPPTKSSHLRRCGICLESFPPTQGVFVHHFLCKECACNTFRFAMENNELFPARCCPGTQIPLHFLEHLLIDEPEFINRYRRRAEKFDTPVSERLHCSDPKCGAYIPRGNHMPPHGNLYAVCTESGCVFRTCTTCKKEWQTGHQCFFETQPQTPIPNTATHIVNPTANHTTTQSLPRPSIRQDWVPPYSSDARFKQCPFCERWTEHNGQCNHMFCIFCRSAWCFVCLSPYGDCNPEGICPHFEDPEYDEELYEMNERGLHRDTGRDRAGLARAELEERRNTAREAEWNRQQDEHASSLENQSIRASGNREDTQYWNNLDEPAGTQPRITESQWQDDTNPWQPIAIESEALEDGASSPWEVVPETYSTFSIPSSGDCQHEWPTDTLAIKLEHSILCEDCGDITFMPQTCIKCGLVRCLPCSQKPEESHEDFPEDYVDPSWNVKY